MSDETWIDARRIAAVVYDDGALRQLRDLETDEVVPLCRALVAQAGKSCALDPARSPRARGLVDNWLSAAGGIGTLLDVRLWGGREAGGTSWVFVRRGASRSLFETRQVVLKPTARR